MRSVSTVLVLIAACGKGGGGRTEWATKPLEPVTDTVGGVAFTIDLPDGLTNATPLEPKRERGWHSAMPEDNGWPAIHVDVERGQPTLAAVVGYESHPGVDVVRQEAIAGGLVVTTIQTDHTMASTVVVKTMGDKAVRCVARYANPDGVRELEATRGWLEKVCLSIRPS